METKGPYLSPKCAKGALKALASCATALCAVAAAFALLGGWLAVKLFRYLSTAQRAMPVMEKAARLYIQAHTPDSPPEKKRRGKKPVPPAASDAGTDEEPPAKLHVVRINTK